jgi:hypothetical protein
MLRILLALAISGALPAGDVGDIWVKTDPGAVVYVDGVRSGVSTAEQAGLWVRGVKRGRHEIKVEVPGGGSTTMTVEVQRDRTSSVNVSTMALRAMGRGRKSAVEITLKSYRPPCTAAIGERQRLFSEPSVVVDDVSPGKHRVTVRCGTQSLYGDIEVAPSRVAVLQGDLKSGQLKLMGDRPRVTEMRVKSSTDKIVDAPLSAIAKRALLNAIQPGVEVLDLRIITRQKISITLEFSSSYSLSTLFERLVMAPGVANVEVERADVRRSERATVEVVVEFDE